MYLHAGTHDGHLLCIISTVDTLVLTRVDQRLDFLSEYLQLCPSKLYELYRILNFCCSSSQSQCLDITYLLYSTGMRGACG